MRNSFSANHEAARRRHHLDCSGSHSRPAPVFTKRYHSGSSRFLAASKGELPVKMLVVLAVVALVLVVLAAFIVPTAFRQTSLADAQRVFASKCIQYRQPGVEENYLSAYSARSDAEFMSACSALGYGDASRPNRCLERCPADLEVTEEDLNRNHKEVLSGVVK